MEWEETKSGKISEVLLWLGKSLSGQQGSALCPRFVSGSQ